jgi:hypothetical protein
MGIFKTLFSGDVVKSGINLIDKAFYTDSEKAENFNKLLSLYEPYKIAQRLLALVIGLPFVALHIIVGILWVYSIFSTGPGLEYKFVFEQLKLVGEWNNNTLGEPFIYVIIFYFGGGAFEGVVKRYKDVDKAKEKK